MNTLKNMYPSVAFGTSGVRALVADLSAAVVSAYVEAFIQHLRGTGQLAAGVAVILGIDLRPSSPRIAADIGRALSHLGCGVEFLGTVPTPALALRCLQARAPGIMVTGSHIPFDRNGIKFYTANGEILKADEEAIAATTINPARLPASCDAVELPQPDLRARELYAQRYFAYFGASALHGLRIGLYEHSAVGRDITRSILEGLGATVISLGRSDTFVPIDTEAVDEEDLALARRWCGDHGLNALVSTDGDGDRPLVFDERGEFVRGDLLGLICAESLGLRSLAVPVSCNTAIEQSGAFDRVLRTRIGSPYVIAGMDQLVAEGCQGVAGFEANGGFLLGTSVGSLDALPTRDALLPMVALLSLAVREGKPVSALMEALPKRVTHSDRIKDVPSQASAALLNRLAERADARQAFFGADGEIAAIDTTDGLRATFASGGIVHLRASGNAPELRCYAEADTQGRAVALVTTYLERAKGEIARALATG